MKKQWGLTPILIVILVAATVLGGYFFTTNYSNKPTEVTQTPQQAIQPSPTPTESTSSAASPVPIGTGETANWKTYIGDYFSFMYPQSMYIQYQTPTETVWKSDYTPGTFIYGFMILRSQSNPFKILTIGDKMSVYEMGNDKLTPMERIVSDVSDTQSFKLGKTDAKRYSLGCEVDCAFHLVQFQSDNQHDQLIFYGAGGGLAKKFDQILSTFKFTQ